MRLSVVLAALLLLTGCEPRLAIDADFDRYLSRIANVQQRDALSPLGDGRSIASRKT